MFGFTSILPAAVLGLVFVAQASAASNSTFDASGLDPTTKAGWCLAQTNNCNNLCGNQYETNSCDNTSLDWACTCSDGTSPDMSQYTGTIATFECLSQLNTCVSSTQDLDTQKQCKKTFVCGTKTPKLVSASSSATPSPSATGSSSVAASTTGASSTTSASAAPKSTGAAATRGYSSELVAGAGLMAAVGILF